MVSFNDCDDILCTNSNCYFCEGGQCYVSYNQLSHCVCPKEFIDVRIQVLENYIKDIPWMIDEEYRPQELSNAKRSKQFWESLRDLY